MTVSVSVLTSVAVAVTVAVTVEVTVAVGRPGRPVLRVVGVTVTWARAALWRSKQKLAHAQLKLAGEMLVIIPRQAKEDDNLREHPEDLQIACFAGDRGAGSK